MSVFQIEMSKTVRWIPAKKCMCLNAKQNYMIKKLKRDTLFGDSYHFLARSVRSVGGLL